MLTNNHTKPNTALIKATIEKYSGKYFQIENVSLDIELEDRTYKIIRLTDEQLDHLEINSVSIHFGTFLQLMSLAKDKSLIFRSFAKMYVTLKELFGETSNSVDPWKNTFYFPFLILFQKAGVEYAYLMKVYNVKTGIQFSGAKLIPADDESLNRDVIHVTFPELSTEEIDYLIDYFVGYLTGYFEVAVEPQYNEFFFQSVSASNIIFGYQDGEFFDHWYDIPEEFEVALAELKKKQNK